MITMAEAKLHLRVDHNAEDMLIADQIAAAGDYIASIGVTEVDLDRPAVKQASLLLIAHFYENREASADARVAKLPLGFASLVAPYREVHP